MGRPCAYRISDNACRTAVFVSKTPSLNPIVSGTADRLTGVLVPCGAERVWAPLRRSWVFWLLNASQSAAVFRTEGANFSAAIRARLAAATEGPWCVDPHDGWIESETVRDHVNEPTHEWEPRIIVDGGYWTTLADKLFVAAAPTDVARLLAEVERLRNRERVLSRDLHGFNAQTCVICSRRLLPLICDDDAELQITEAEARATKAEAERDELRAQSTVSRIAYETLAAANAALRSRTERAEATLRRIDGINDNPATFSPAIHAALAALSGETAQNEG